MRQPVWTIEMISTYQMILILLWKTIGLGMETNNTKGALRSSGGPWKMENSQVDSLLWRLITSSQEPWLRINFRIQYHHSSLVVSLQTGWAWTLFVVFSGDWARISCILVHTHFFRLASLHFVLFHLSHFESNFCKLIICPSPGLSKKKLCNHLRSHKKVVMLSCDTKIYQITPIRTAIFSSCQNSPKDVKLAFFSGFSYGPRFSHCPSNKRSGCFRK